MNVLNRRFSSILVANRGEIACRIMRTAKALGYQTIAVYSEADRNAPHVSMADTSYLLGPAPALHSYLNSERILQAAKDTSADAIHPGYGFLSENADFAEACAANQISFIGPSPEAIFVMGDKAKAKSRMIKAGVTCIPGYEGDDQSDAYLKSKAAEIGYPVMIKAAAGGGGKGMRLVDHEKDLQSGLETARSEAENAFGSSHLILERALKNPRHVEIQIFADMHGNIIHLGERDCSVQRRHQKVIEEAPCPAITPSLRNAMGSAAVKAARDIGYRGAGTVEFLLDEHGNFYFLEMNTRLQVEHPVTEMITGLDLVEMQIDIAQGLSLKLDQNDISLSGHAIEARLYAENPADDFLPSSGPVISWRPPTTPGIRVDTGVTTGSEISPYYDPMIAKIIAHGPTRHEARLKLIAALKETVLFGPSTNRKFLIDALRNSTFANGDATTGFISEQFGKGKTSAPSFSNELAVGATVLFFLSAQSNASQKQLAPNRALHNWTSGRSVSSEFDLSFGEDEFLAVINAQAPNEYSVDIDDRRTIALVDNVTPDLIELRVDGKPHKFFFSVNPAADSSQIAFIAHEGGDYRIVNRNKQISTELSEVAAGAVVAPMHGLIVELNVEPGASVKKGDRLAVLEAMKMQHDLLAPIDGIVENVHASLDTQVAAKTLLFAIEKS